MDRRQTARDTRRPRRAVGGLTGPGRWVVVACDAALLSLALFLGVARLVEAAAPSGTGTVPASAAMGIFTPNLVMVGSAAYSSLHVEFTPPPGVPEGDLTTFYNWTVTKVMWQAVKSSTPTDVTSKTGTDYNYSISPAQPAASSGAYLAFTPLIAGYWQVSMECSLTVNNILNGQVFFGEATAGPQDLTSALVTFSPNPITTGADKTTAGAVFAPVTATVSPNDLIGSVSVNNFNNQGAGRAAIENSSPNTSTGVIAFDVYGTVGTSVSMPNGDI